MVKALQGLLCHRVSEFLTNGSCYEVSFWKECRMVEMRCLNQAILVPLENSSRISPGGRPVWKSCPWCDFLFPAEQADQQHSHVFIWNTVAMGTALLVNENPLLQFLLNAVTSFHFNARSLYSVPLKLPIRSCNCNTFIIMKGCKSCSQDMLIKNFRKVSLSSASLMLRYSYVTLSGI